MKLRHQLMVLLIVPVVCQLGTVAVLVQAVSGVDRAASQELKAKEIIGLTRDINGVVAVSVLEMTGKGFSRLSTGDGATEVASSLETKLKRLRELTNDNPKAKRILDRMEIEVPRFLETWRDLVGSWRPGQEKMFFAQFFYKEEAFESLRKGFVTVRNDAEELNEIYRPIAKEFRPEAIQARSKLRDAIIAVIVANIIFVIVLSFIVRKESLLRLQTLMENIRAFSRGEKTLKELTGKDELAELDEAFREMSQERWKLDEIQKSLRAMVSHDLRSPLTSMSLSLDALLESPRYDALDPHVKKTLTRMSSETHRLSRLARTLLDIEKLEGGHIVVDKEDVSADLLVESSLGAVSSLAERKKMTIEKQVDASLIISCDQERTIQSLVNLLSNAIKFAPPSSRIIIAVKEDEPSAANGSHADARPSGKPQARFEVIDQGPGVPENQIDLLFGKFKQLEQAESTKKEGSGLGLYICRLLIEAQSGSIGYHRISDIGSCFWFTLPTSACGNQTIEKQELSLKQRT
jgi:signal transduction histidine kinase